MRLESGTSLACPICQLVDTALEFPHASGPALRFPLVRCSSCGLVFLEEFRDEAQLDDAQRTAYGEPQRRFVGPFELLVRGFRLGRVRFARRLMPPGGSVLDVGCGRGLFLHLLRERGYEVKGTELSAATVRNAYPDLPISVGDLRPGLFPDATFDLVSIWHVLEHLRFPDQALEVAFRALRPGGKLMLAVPNYGSVQARLGGERWFHLAPPRPLVQFTAGWFAQRVSKSSAVEPDSGRWIPSGSCRPCSTAAGSGTTPCTTQFETTPRTRPTCRLSRVSGCSRCFPSGWHSRFRPAWSCVWPGVPER